MSSSFGKSATSDFEKMKEIKCWFFKLRLNENCLSCFPCMRRTSLQLKAAGKQKQHRQPPYARYVTWRISSICAFYPLVFYLPSAPMYTLIVLSGPVRIFFTPTTNNFSTRRRVCFLLLVHQVTNNASVTYHRRAMYLSHPFVVQLTQCLSDRRNDDDVRPALLYIGDCWSKEEQTESKNRPVNQFYLKFILTSAGRQWAFSQDKPYLPSGAILTSDAFIVVVIIEWDVRPKLEM